MTTSGPATTAASIAAATHIGGLALTVADLGASIVYYQRALGLNVLQRLGANAILGVGSQPLLRLTEQPGARPWQPDGATGLYHLALLLPSRPDLGRWLHHYLSQGYPAPGQGDHYVSEAFYLRDPDGHGIEVYADRPRSTWNWVNGRVRMGVDPIDIDNLLAEARRAGGQWQGAPDTTTLGHVHLQVGSIPAAAVFYHQLLGFDIVANLPSALFVSAGGYHHHLGLNTWHSLGARPASPDTLKLQFFSLALPDEAALAAVQTRLTAAGQEVAQHGDSLVVLDPWQTPIHLHIGPVTTTRLLADGSDS